MSLTSLLMILHGCELSQGSWVHVLNEKATPSFRISGTPDVSADKIHSLCNKVVKFSSEVKAVFIFFLTIILSIALFFFLFARIFKAPLSHVNTVALHKIITKPSKNPNCGC